MKIEKEIEWDINRIKEFLRLKKMIRIIIGLNNGNNFIQKIQKVITIVKELNESDIRTSETSFVDFLEELIKSDLAKLTKG